MRIRLVVTALAAGLLAAGCSRTPPANAGVPYRLGEKDGKLTMTFNKLTLLFEGVAAKPGINGSGGTIIISKVPGNTSGGSSSFDGIEVKHAEAEGTSTVTVNGYTFKLIDGGAKLVLGDKTYDVNDEQTVTVPK
jgi:hypothetical protein